jgi:hypothetical protein
LQYEISRRPILDFFDDTRGNQRDDLWFHPFVKGCMCAVNKAASGPPSDRISLRHRRAAFRGTTLGSDQNTPKKTPEQPTRSTKVGSKDRDMGAALRSVYQRTVEEAVPDEMLDLLGKLD